MSIPIDPLNEEQKESPFGDSENEHEFEAHAGFTAHGITGGKGPGFASESESE
jgi:hypothetical protein